MLQITNRHSTSADLSLFSAQLQGLNHDDPERAHHVVMLIDGNVLSAPEHVVAEAVTGLVVIRITEEIVVERPRPSGLSNKMTDLVVLAFPETQHPAAIAMRLPASFIDMTIVIERSSELVTARPAALGKVVISGKFQSNLEKAH